MTIALLVMGVLLLPVFYNLLFPFKQPHLDNYFLPGQTFTSEAEGVTQTIISQDGDKVFVELRFAPNAAGTPEHLHLGFDESATVTAGTLTANVGGAISKIGSGERIVLRKGTYHRMYNETDQEVIVRADNHEDYVPLKFAYSLAQLYPLMSTDGGLSLRMFAKICVLDHLFDTVPSGPPPAFFRAVKKIVKPYARLFGITPYDDKSRPK